MKMKNNIILSILALSIVVLGCEEDIERPILDADNAVSTPASFTSAATADAKVITLETLADTFEVFKWDPIVYGVDIANNSCLLIQEWRSERLTMSALKESAEIYELFSQVSKEYDRDYSLILSALCYDLAWYQANALCMLKTIKIWRNGY